MKTAVVPFIILGVIVVLAGLGYLAYRGVVRRAGVNVEDMERLRKDRAILRDALTQVDDAAMRYRELDSPLAGEINDIIRETRKKRDDL